jgi:methyl-accepting chemotaxis protein
MAAGNEAGALAKDYTTSTTDLGITLTGNYYQVQASVALEISILGSAKVNAGLNCTATALAALTAYPLLVEGTQGARVMIGWLDQKVCVGLTTINYNRVSAVTARLKNSLSRFNNAVTAFNATQEKLTTCVSKAQLAGQSAALAQAHTRTAVNTLEASVNHTETAASALRQTIGSSNEVFADVSRVLGQQSQVTAQASAAIGQANEVVSAATRLVTSASHTAGVHMID